MWWWRRWQRAISGLQSRFTGINDGASSSTPACAPPRSSSSSHDPASSGRCSRNNIAECTTQGAGRPCLCSLCSRCTCAWTRPGLSSLGPALGTLGTLETKYRHPARKRPYEQARTGSVGASGHAVNTMPARADGGSRMITSTRAPSGANRASVHGRCTQTRMGNASAVPTGKTGTRMAVF